MFDKIKIKRSELEELRFKVAKIDGLILDELYKSKNEAMRKPHQLITDIAFSILAIERR